MAPFARGVVAGAAAMAGVVVLGAVLILSRPLTAVVTPSPRVVTEWVAPTAAPLAKSLAGPLTALLTRRVDEQVTVQVGVGRARVRLPRAVVRRMVESLSPTVTRTLLAEVKTRRFETRVLAPAIVRALRRRGRKTAPPALVPVTIWPGVTLWVRVALGPPAR